MTQCCYSEKTGVFYDHLVILYHVEERYDQLIIVDGDNVVQVLLDIWEDILERMVSVEKLTII